MEPYKVFKELHRIANSIDNSKNPSIKLINRDINSLLQKLASKEMPPELKAAVPVALTAHMKKLVENYVDKYQFLTEADFQKALKTALEEVFY